MRKPGGTGGAMRLKDILRGKAAEVKEAIAKWKIAAPASEIENYVGNEAGTLRRRDVAAAGGRREFRAAKREKRRKKIAALKAGRAA